MEVRRLLLGIPGVKNIYASSGFRIVELEYDDAKLSPKQIELVLDEAGYMGEMPLETETGIAATEEGANSFFRHTAAYEQTGKTVGFTQQVPYNGRPLWPCPGMGPIKSDKEKVTHG
jgi:hypothetical protein